MKTIVILLGFAVLLAGCKDAAVSKPGKIIDEETMVNIIYDLSVLEAMKSKNPALSGKPTSAYIYNKYHIDSLQFAENNRYYAAEIEKYKKIYDQVNERLETNRKIADSIARRNGEKVSETPTLITSEVK